MLSLYAKCCYVFPVRLCVRYCEGLVDISPFLKTSLFPSFSILMALYMHGQDVSIIFIQNLPVCLSSTQFAPIRPISSDLTEI